jgi:hypothetical protein
VKGDWRELYAIFRGRANGDDVGSPSDRAAIPRSIPSTTSWSPIGHSAVEQGPTLSASTPDFIGTAWWARTTDPQIHKRVKT